MTVEGMTEEYFPRGGNVREITKKRNFVFESKKQSEPKAKKPGKRERKKKARDDSHDGQEEAEADFVIQRFERLTYKGLSEGTLVLCSVRGIYNKYVDINMPGRLAAKLYIENVSRPYYDILKKITPNENEEEARSLNKLFRIGQHLSCSVLSVGTPGNDVRLTSDPAIVNSHYTFADVTIGSVIQMAVESVEDHGFMMFSGIPGLISFLPNTNAVSFIDQLPDEKSLCIGQIVWCLVTKSKLTGSSNTINVSIDLSSIAESTLKDDVSMEKLSPGVQVNATITKIVSQTLLMSIQGSTIHGYVEESQLSTPWSKISDYKNGSSHTATVLFKFPYAKIVALTLKSGPATITNEEIKQGTIFENAEIKSIMKRGVCLKLDYNGRSLKGMISVRRIGENVDYDSLSTQFPVGNHITCRVIGFDALEQVYSCSIEDHILKEKYISPADIVVGESVEVTAESFKKGGLEVSLGLIKAYVPALHISDVVLQNPFEKVKLHSKYKGKVLLNDQSKLVITLRPTLVKNPSLIDFNSVKVGEAYYGFVTKILPDQIVVSFFGNTFSTIKEQNLLEPAHKYSIGELVKCFIVKTRPNKPPVLSLLKSVQSLALTVGNKYDVIVKDVSDEGLKCLFLSQGQQFNGFLPVEHLSDFPEFCQAEMKKYAHGSQISNVLLFSVNDKLPLFTMRQSVLDFFQNFPEISQGIKALTTDTLLPCSVSEILSDKIFVSAPVPRFNGKIPIEAKFLPKPVSSYSKYQGIVARVKHVQPKFKIINLTCKLSADIVCMCSITHLTNLFDYVRPLQKHRPGQTVKCFVKDLKSDFANVFTSSTKIQGILVGFEPGSLKVNDTLKAIVLFHDIDKDIIYLHPNNGKIKLFEVPESSLKNNSFSGKPIFVNNHFALVLVEISKTLHNLAFIPRDLSSLETPMEQQISPFKSCSITLRTFNEWNDDKSVYYWIGNIGSKKRKNKSENILEDDSSNRVSKKKLKLATETVVDSQKLKRKKIQADQNPLKHGSPSEQVEEEIPNKKKSKKSDIQNVLETPEVSTSKLKCSGDVLLEDAAAFDWDASEKDLVNAIYPTGGEDLSQDESEEEVNSTRKLTSSEKRAAAAEKEREIRAKEEELLLSESKPESSEHFDRLLAASPNSSRLWIMYMAHHMQATEIEKARSVAKRALKHINVRLEDERLNVWIASLNLENIYGTPDSFKEILTEALKYNDDYKVQLRVLDIYAESKKTTELEKLVNQLVKKYKEKVDCWLSCQEALMKAGLEEKARHFLQRSLEALPNKEYCSLISRFALVENKFGFADQAQSLFENLLTSYPKRTDLWFVYIDMLTKSGSVDLARNVLERATSQKLPIRKMKSLYQKWLKLEESYGSAESVQQVKDAAAEFVKNLTSTLAQ